MQPTASRGNGRPVHRAAGIGAARRLRLSVLLPMALVAAAIVFGASHLSARRVPLNILLITADDLGKTLGAYGDPLAMTPNLDALAAEGVLFERAYVTQASCSPSRSSLLTGLYPHQNGHVGLANAHPEYRLKPGIPNLPALLKDAGYFNAIIGKLHIAPGSEFPFDREWSSHTNVAQTRDVRMVAQKAGEFIAQRGKKPFFLYVNYFDPHRPYDDDARQFQGLPEAPYTAAQIEPFAYLGLDDANIRREIASYYNAVRRMDTGVGLLLDTLREAGALKHTLVIFVSDHGVPFTRAKTTSYEAGVGIPYLVRWPQVSVAGLRHTALVSTLDILPTILDAAGISPPPTEGQSLRGILQNQTPATWRTELFTEYTSHAPSQFYPRRTVRNDRFKLIHNLDFGRANPSPFIGGTRILSASRATERTRQAYLTMLAPPEYELYDLDMDPHETINLVDVPGHAEMLAQLQARLLQWRQETLDPLLDPLELQRLRDTHGL